MSPHHSNKSSNTWLIDISFLAIFIFAFYLCWLGSYPLFTPDEGRYSEVAREMIATGNYITPRVNGVAFLDKPILYYWLQVVAISLFGIKEWALRFFPALIGMFGCLVTYVCGRNLFDRSTAIFSALILATTPLYFSGAHYANLDLEVAVWISSTLLCVITAIQTKNNSKNIFLFAAYCFAAFAFLTKGLIGIVFPIMITGAWIALQNRWRLLLQIHLIKGFILFTLIVLPWYALVQNENPEFLHYFFVTQQFSRFLSAETFNNPTPFWFYFPIILISFLPWTSFLFQALASAIVRYKKNHIQHATELYLLLWSGIIFIFFSIPHSKIITYILPIFPSLALLTGNYLSRAYKHISQSNIYYNFLSAFIFCLAFSVALFSAAHFNWLQLPSQFIFYLKIMAGIYFITAIIILFLLNQKNLRSLVIISICCNILFLLTLTLGAKYLNQNTAKPLYLQLKTILKPEDEVVNYLKYFQDSPIYLERQVSIVADWDDPNIAKNDNWLREFWYGMPNQNTKSWLINENEFWKRWNSNKRMFVFLNKKYFNNFKIHAGIFYFLGEHNEIILLSNKLIK